MYLVALVQEGDHQPRKVVEYARMRNETTKGVPSTSKSRPGAVYAGKAKKNPR